ncbi:type IV secretion system protein (plasmid) [Cereibacter azotoformans]|uniref:type IV secretion system protein n=1 Tax=Cereibacter azotoformans TaxID=43057 RepID=UPI001EEB21BD|nr:type IV secretion system protein [Cereibacter azotoformans]ULB12792.1 type IV secretion system protein [Cereibacter azotoformans]
MLQMLYDNFVASLTDKMNTVSSAISGELTAPLTAAMTLYIMLYGWAILRGSIHEPVMDFTIRGVKLAIIWTLVANAGDYSSWVGDTITNGIPAFVETIAGGTPASLPSDPVMAMAGEMSMAVQEAYGTGIAGSIYGYLMSMVVWLSAIPFAALAFVVSLLVHFGLTLLASIGPLFIGFALFDFSRGWFFAWLGQTLNFAILKLLVIVLMITITAFLGDVYTTVDIEAGAAAVAAFLVALACATLFFFLLPSIAAALSAGVGASTGVAQRFVERKILGGFGGGGLSGGSAQSGSATRTS